MKRAFVFALTCIVLVSVFANSQTRRRTPQKRATATATFEEKRQAEIRAGRQQIATQIKTLTQFLFLFGNISKGIETAEQVNRNREQTSVGMPPERIEQSKAKVRDSIKSLRIGLDQLESSFRLNPVLQSYYSNVAGVAKFGQTAETQAAANSFDQAGRSLIAAVNKLADALAAIPSQIVQKPISMAPNWAPFVERLRGNLCSNIRNRLFVLDQKLVFADREGDCPDNSYGRILFGKTIDDVLCWMTDSNRGPRKGCNDPSYQGLFDTIIAHLDEPDLGLGPSHKVQPLRLPLRSSKGSSRNAAG